MQAKFDDTWESLDKRPIPQWYDDAKFGILLHWGVYSVPGIGSEWFWKNLSDGDKDAMSYMTQNYPPNSTYQDLARNFTANLYEPASWAKLFEKSGAKYVILTNKHHDGYTLWPSQWSFCWNAKDIGSHRDVLGELCSAVRRKTALKFGIYYSQYEWFHPQYKFDKLRNYTEDKFVSQKTMPEMADLVMTYRPDIFWSDGDGEAEDVYWQSTQFLAWLYNDSPVKDTVVVNDKWGKGTAGRHGGYHNCGNNYNPRVFHKHKWENVMSIDKESWGYRRNGKYEDYHTVKELIHMLVETVSCGGNLLMNIGPTGDGRIPHVFQDRLLGVGQWLSVNGPAIYGTRPWIVQRDTLSTVWYTASKSSVNAIVLEWPQNNTLVLRSAVSLFKESTTVSLLGHSENLRWQRSNGEISVQFPDKATVEGSWAWVLEIQSDK